MSLQTSPPLRAGLHPVAPTLQQRLSSGFTVSPRVLAIVLLALLILLTSPLHPAHAQTPNRPFEDSMAERVRACTACHGEQGRAGPDGYYPRLAGKPEGYLYQQLTHFRDGRRHYPLMAGLLGTLNDSYLHDIAHHFATLNLPYSPPTPNRESPAVLALGQKLATQGDAARQLPACTQCHGKNGAGIAPNVPGLLGLPRDYLSAQLNGWKTGQRQAHAPDCMRLIAQKLSDADIYATAAWLSAQAPNSTAPLASGNITNTPLAAPNLPTPPCGSGPSKSTNANTNTNTTTAANTATPPSNAAAVTTATASPVARGAYLARIGNCAQCHTAIGGAPYAGGRGIDTPFGRIYTSNLTPDTRDGIGRWTAQDFWQALHHGKAPDGRLLYPAFPYTSFTHIQRADSDALWAYLQTLPAVAQPNLAHTLDWPMNRPWALWLWRSLFFRPDDRSTTTQDQGQYLVEGLGHCNECHLARNALGALRQDSRLGGILPGTRWYAPPLSALTQPTSPDLAPPSWTQDSLAQFLTTGIRPYGFATGPMAEVVLHSTQYLSADDARAMARYLVRAKDNPAANNGNNNDATTRSASRPSAKPFTPQRNTSPVLLQHKGEQLYTQHCAACHGKQGLGHQNAYPALADNPAVTRSNANNLIHIVLYGGYPSATAGNPRPYGMPPFVLQYSDADVAAVLSYIRSAWGNQAAPVSEFDVHQFRN